EGLANDGFLPRADGARRGKRLVFECDGEWPLACSLGLAVTLASSQRSTAEPALLIRLSDGQTARLVNTDRTADGRSLRQRHGAEGKAGKGRRFEDVLEEHTHDEDGTRNAPAARAVPVAVP